MTYGIHDPMGSGKTGMKPAFNFLNPRTWKTPFIIATDGSVRARLPKDGKVYDLDELQEIVGGYIEIQKVPQDNSWVAVMNEEGKIQNPPLPANKVATELLQLDVIVGNVLICPSVMIS